MMDAYLKNGLWSLIIFILFSFSNLISANEIDMEQLTKEQAIAIIQKTALDKRKEIAKEIWLKSEIIDALGYKVLWKAGTERPFTSPLNDEKRSGVFKTIACDIPVFSSEHKFESGTGWPSFTHAIDEANVILKSDYSYFGIKRVEVLSKCGEHLGHVFDDGPRDRGGKRWCINGAALKFIPKETI